jgi:hypothetical protein
MSAKESKHDIAAEMLNQLRQLEEEFAMHSGYLKEQIEKIKTS